MKLPTKSIVVLASALALMGCSDDNPFKGLDEGQGLIHPNITTSGSVLDAAPTRADGDLEVPDLDAFEVSLTKSDGSYSKTWQSVKDFPTDQGFAIGEYTLAVSCGDVNAEGFNCPAFYGESVFTVFPDDVASPTVTATLANCMVSVNYTDAFKTYFKTYSTTLHSEGHGYNTILSEDTEPMFVVPGHIEVSLNVIRQDGKSVTLQPTYFEGQARHHYHMTLDVNGGAIGVAKLIISFDDSIDEEHNVTIDLSEDLMNTPSPEVSPNGFANGQVINVLQGSAFDKLQYDIFAYAGLASAKFNLESDSYTMGLGDNNVVDFVGLTPEQQSIATSLGFDVKGLYKNVDRIAYVEFSKFAAQLPEGSHKISLVAKDKYTRVNEPVYVTIDVTGKVFELVSTEPVPVGSTEGNIIVAYNGDNLANELKVQVRGGNGVYANAEVLNIEKMTTRAVGEDAFPTNNYRVTIRIPESTETLAVRVFNGTQQVGEGNIQIKELNYGVSADAFAKLVKLKISGEDAAVVTKYAKVYVNDAEVAAENLSRSGDIITIAGLVPGTQYSIKTAVSGKQAENVVTTETEQSLTNGDFSESHQTINISSINAGGSYLVGAITYQAKSSIVVNEPVGWQSINAKTCYSGSANKNTWYMVPSTMLDNKIVTIRSVAYDHNGAEIARTGSFWSTTYYNPNPPSEFANKESGELFLGNYSFNGSETKEYGVAFANRPSSVSFTCNSYEAYGSDSGQAYVAVLDNSGNVLATASCAITAAKDKYELPLTDYKFGVKAAKIDIRFKSSSGTVDTKVPSGSELNEGTGLSTSGGPVAANSYKNLSVGSVLKISNVYVTY